MNSDAIKSNRHILLFSCPQKFENLSEDAASEKYSYFIRNPVEISEMISANEQENYINEIFKDRNKNIWNVFTVDNFDALYSFAKALSEPRPNDSDNGTVTAVARGLLASGLASCLTKLQNSCARESLKHQKLLKENDGNISASDTEKFNFSAAMLRGATNMIVCLLTRVMTAPVLHWVPNDDQNQQQPQHQNNNENRGVDRLRDGKKKKKPKKGLRESAEDVWDGVDVDTVESVLRGFVEMMAPEASHIWSAHPVPIKDFIDDDDDEEDRFDKDGNPVEPNYKNRHELGRPKNSDSMPDPEIVLSGIKIITHLAGQKRTFVSETDNNALGKGVIDALKVLGRAVSLRYERSPAVRAAIEKKQLEQRFGVQQQQNGQRNSFNSNNRMMNEPTPDEMGAFDIGINRGNQVPVKKDAEAIEQQEQETREKEEAERLRQQRQAASSTPAADPRNVLVTPLLDILLRVNPGDVATEIAKLIVALLLDYNHLPNVTQPDDPNNQISAEDFATMLYLQGGDGSTATSNNNNNNNSNNNMMMMNSNNNDGSGTPPPAGASSSSQQQSSQSQGHAAADFALFSAVSDDGSISEALALAKLVSYFLEAIIRSGINAEPSSREAKNVATFVDRLAITQGALPLVAKHAPILMPLLQSECYESRKSCITLICELVAELYASPSHHSWAVAVEQVTAAAATGGKQQQDTSNSSTTTTNHDEDEDVPLVQRAANNNSMLQYHELRPELVRLRDGYLRDLAQRPNDINPFVRLHTIKCWEQLVRRKAVPRCLHEDVFHISVARLADRNHLVRCSSLGLLRACIQASWFSDHLSYDTLKRRFEYEFNHCLKKIEDEVRHGLLMHNNSTNGGLDNNNNQDKENNNNNKRAKELSTFDEERIRTISIRKLKKMIKVMKSHMMDDAGGRTKGKSVMQTSSALQFLDEDSDEDEDDNDGNNNQQQKQLTEELEGFSVSVKQEAAVTTTVGGNNNNNNKNQINDNFKAVFRQQHKYDVFLARLVFLEAAFNAAGTAEQGLHLAVDMLASKTNKDITDAMSFIVAASAARLDSAPAACEKVLLLIFHHDPAITNAVCDAFVSVYYTSFDGQTTASPQARDLARVQKIVSLLNDSSEGTFAAVEKIIDTLANRMKTREQGAAASAQAAGLLAQARGGVRGAASRTNTSLFFSRDFFDANWGMIDGTLDPNINPHSRRTALRLYGCLARCEPREIQSRRADIVRLIQAFPKDNLLVANAFHVLAKESVNVMSQVDNLDPDFDPVFVNLVDANNNQGRNSGNSMMGNNNNNNHNSIYQTSKISMLRAVKLATLHLARPTEHCQGWISLAEAVITFLSSVLIAPAYLFAQIIESVHEQITGLEDLSEKTASTSASTPNVVSREERENIQLKLLNRRAQFMFLLGHTCVKHLVTIEEYEKRELAAVSERGNVVGGGGGNSNNNNEGRNSHHHADPVGRDSTGSIATTRASSATGRGKKGAAAAAAGRAASTTGGNNAAGEDNMSKELGMNNSEFQRNKVKDSCERARELTCLSDTHPMYKKISEGVPQQLLVPPVWGKYAKQIIKHNHTKFTNTAGIAASNHLQHNQDAATASSTNAMLMGNLSPRLYRAMVTHRSASTLCLIKLMVASANFCQKELPLLFTLLQQNDEPWEVKTGIVIGLGDLACTHPNLLQPYMKISSSGFYALLADADVRVRSVAIQICTHLVLNDMLIVGDHVHTIVRLAADQDATIRHSAEAFSAYLAVKRQKELHNIIPPLVKALSITEEVGATNAIVAAGVQDDIHHQGGVGGGVGSGDDDDDEDSDDNEDAAAPRASSGGRLSAAAKKKLEAEQKKKKEEQLKKKKLMEKEAQKQKTVRRLPPMNEADFQQAIKTLLENVDKSAIESLIQKLCSRFTRYTDSDQEMIQFHRNLCFCLSELPFTTEKEVKQITNQKYFEKYKDWLRDHAVAEYFDKIVTKARRNISAGRGVGGGVDNNGGASPVPGADAQQTERRDRVLLDEWAIKLQDAAAGGIANRPKKVDDDGAVSNDDDDNNDNNNNNNMMMMNSNSNSKKKSSVQEDAAVSTSRRRNVKSRLVDSSTSEDDSSSSSDDSSGDNNNRRKKKAVVTKQSRNSKAAKPSPKPKKKAAAAKKSSAGGGSKVKREDLDDEIDNDSSSNDDSDDDSSSSDDSSSNDSIDNNSSSDDDESSEEEEQTATRRRPSGKKAPAPKKGRGGRR